MSLPPAPAAQCCGCGWATFGCFADFAAGTKTAAFGAGALGAGARAEAPPEDVAPGSARRRATSFCTLC